MLGFNNSHHGNSTATLSVSSSSANPHDLPAFPWPKGPFPQLRYPLAENEHFNNEEENRCLLEVDRIIHSRGTWGQVGAIIVEPTSTFGNQFATPRFFKGLRKLASQHGIPLIVDETKTGIGASGKNWAHEYWYLHEDQAPDFVTFGGKSGLGGFYSTIEHRLNEEATSFQQHLDIVKLLQYGQIWRQIEQGNLLHLQKDTSSFLKIELERIGKGNHLISNIRGYGTHLGFDSNQGRTLQRWLLKNGINIGMSGPNTFALRPSMILGVRECVLLRDNLPFYSVNHDRYNCREV